MRKYKLIKNEDCTYTVFAPNEEQYLFDSEGRLSEITDNTGKKVSFNYLDLKTIITDNISGKSITFNYNSDRHIVSINSDDRTTILTYDGNYLSSVTDPEGNTTNYTYDTKGRIEKETNSEGITYVTNKYDEKGRVVSQINATNDNINIAYTDKDNGTDIKVIDALSNEKYMYVNRNEQITCVVNENGGKTKYTYNDGNIEYEEDSYGNVIYREYDSSGNMTKYTDTGNCTTSMTYDDRNNITSMTNADGNTAAFVYNDKNLKTEETDYSGKKTVYTYNSDGLLESETIEGLGTKTYTYKNGLQESVTDFNGNTSFSEYDAAGNLIKVVDPLGNITKYKYNKNNLKTEEVFSDGSTKKYTYDCNSNMISAVDQLGNKTLYTYDGNGRKTIETLPDGGKIKHIYDGNGNEISVTDAAGNTTDYEYDSSGNVIKEKYADKSYVTYTYDLLNERTSEKDSDGNTIEYEYYYNGNIHKEIYKDKNEEILKTKLYTYNSSWKLITVTEDGADTSYTYDDMGNVTSHSDANGNTEEYTYDLNGRLVKQTDPNGNSTLYEYDAEGNCIKRINALGVPVYMTYDAMNRMTSKYNISSDGTVHKEKYTYDIYGHVISTTDAEGNISHVEYDAAGNVIKITDALGHIIQTSDYDSMNRVISKKDANGNSSVYTYDKVGKLIKEVQYLNSEAERKYSYTYDRLGRIESTIDPEKGTTSCTYDSNGNMTSVTDAMGGTNQYSYDGLGRITKEKNAIDAVTEYTYNAEGLLNSRIDAADRKTEYKYDAGGRIILKTDEAGKVKYTYDKNSNVLTVSDSKGKITREYDALNRVTSYTDVNGNKIKYLYDENGYLTDVTYPDNSHVKYTYYLNGFLHTVTDGNGNTTTYTYDQAGRLIKTDMPDGTEEIDTYDNKGQITSQTTKKSDKIISTYSYSYDEAGNITQSTGTDEKCGEVIKSASMTYDSQNRMLTFNDEKVKYDVCGNMTYGPVDGNMTELTYDARNRLVSAGDTKYTYDAEDNRIRVETKEYVEEIVTDTVTSELPEAIMITRTNKAGTQSVSKMVYGKGLISENTNGVYQFHHYNNVGSTKILTDSNGEILEEYSYGTYGELVSGDSKKSRYLYNGRYGVTTEENGLYYMRQRYYNASIKRFINQDIVKGNMSESQSLNRYSYVQGNPVTMTDPFGLSPINPFNGGGLIHGILDWAGCVPGAVGFVANMANAAIYALVDHDYAMAGLSALAGATMGVGKLVAMGGKVAKAAKIAQAAGNLVSNTASFAVCTGQAVGLASDMWKKYHTEGKRLGGDTVVEALALGMNLAGMCMSGKGMMSSGNKLSNALKESRVTSKIAGKIKNGAKTLASDNRGIVDFEAKIGGSKGGTNSSNPQSYLDRALKNQGLDSTPAKMKEVWTEGDYKYTVRIHEGNATYTDAESIYRVSRKSTVINGQGSGMEYLGTDGNWYSERVLKEFYKDGSKNLLFNENASKITHISIGGN